MQRRTFLKTTAIFSSAVLLTPNFAFAKEENPFGITSKPRKFSIKNNYVINPSQDLAQAWIPLPKDESYQKVISFSYEGNFSEAKNV